MWYPVFLCYREVRLSSSLLLTNFLVFLQLVASTKSYNVSDYLVRSLPGVASKHLLNIHSGLVNVFA